MKHESNIVLQLGLVIYVDFDFARNLRVMGEIALRENKKKNEPTDSNMMS